MTTNTSTSITINNIPSKDYNCPDCERTDSCDGCPRVLINKLNKTNVPQIDTPYLPQTIVWDNIPECCRGCSNHPSNGGSGYCNCTAPYFSNHSPYKIT